MDQRRKDGASVPGPLPTPPAGGPWFLRPAPCRNAPGTGRPGARPRYPRLLLLPLLVRGQAAAGAAVQRSPRGRPTGLSVLSVLGQRTVVAPLGRQTSRCPAT